jgi:hypothetical protein
VESLHLEGAAVTRISAAAIGLVAILACPILAVEPKSPEPTIGALSMELAALQSIHRLKLDESQLRKLAVIAERIVDKDAKRPKGKASPEYRKAVESIIEAYRTLSDDDFIGQLEEELETLAGTEKPELDDDFEMTAAARKVAPEFLKLLSARQLTSYLAGAYGDETPDPYEKLVEAMERVRGLSSKEFRDQHNDICDEIGRFAAGLDDQKAGEVSEKALAFLLRVRRLPDAEYKASRVKLKETARNIVGNPAPTDVLRRVMERELAQFLSNPCLAAAVHRRLKR